jgi:hypothetical protein
MSINKKVVKKLNYEPEYYLSYVSLVYAETARNSDSEYWQFATIDAFSIRSFNSILVI